MPKSRFTNSRSAGLGLFGLAIALLLIGDWRSAAPAAAQSALVTDASEVRVTLAAPHTTISWDEQDPDRGKFDLPLLYLHRQREATDVTEHTLQIRVSGLAGGTVVQVEAQSVHADVTTGKRHLVSARFVTPDRPCTAHDPCTLSWTFDARTMLSDLYTLRLKDGTGRTLWENPQPHRPDFAALDTWDVKLGAYVVRVYYATLFPFARTPEELADRLSPAGVTDFVANQFIPIIVATWHTQLEAWEFGTPLRLDWDADGVIDVIITGTRFALFDGTGIYSAYIDPAGEPIPERRIWWLSNADGFERYDTLENACKAFFAHEFFHLLQWNVLLSAGRPTDFWLNTFIEAQAIFAQSVQYPELELSRRHVVTRHSAYAGSASRFLTGRLNASYRDLEEDRIKKYDAALYWRFLYEQYGATDMIQAALEEMVAGYEPDVVGALGRVMDAAFARSSGPFESYAESLVAFARANYALRLENGRCADAAWSACGGFYYDPENVYMEPPLEAQLTLDGAPLAHKGAIPASYGVDFIEVRLAEAVQGEPLTVKLQADGGGARFHLQVWKLGRGIFKPRATSPTPEIVFQDADGAYVYAIPQVDTTAYDHLALIVTRLDSDETEDPVGGYTIALASMAD
jgi:hypothetical protein